MTQQTKSNLLSWIKNYGSAAAFFVVTIGSVYIDMKSDMEIIKKQNSEMASKLERYSDEIAELKGRVSHLEGVNEAKSNNPAPQRAGVFQYK